MGTGAEMVAGFELAQCAPHAWPVEDAEWLPAEVPGGVHETLLAADRIPHPYYGTSEEDVQWIERAWWCYRTEIHVPALPGDTARWLLTFHGLDGSAELRLAGRLRAEHGNQHRPLVVDVSEHAGSNVEVLVRFRPTLTDNVTDSELQSGIDALLARWHALRRDAAPPSHEELSLRVARTRVRKAAFSWGWDFAPRVASVGIHAPVTLGLDPGVSLTGAHIRTLRVDPAARTATISVSPEVSGGSLDAVRLTLAHEGVELLRRQLTPGLITVLELHDVDAWWTHDLGPQPLYVLCLEAVVGGQVVSRWQETIGLRTIELAQEPDAEGGRTFQFRLNGHPLFARGANWVPASMLVGSIEPDVYARSIRAARQAEMNMLRVWGGGIYEPAAFFDACDRQGVLVWQDFMFACDDYPGDDPAFREEVMLEAEHQVRRLRNRACLAVWAGNNEVQALHQLAAGNLAPGNWGWQLFDDVLPSVVARHSPGAPYWPGSPWGALGESVNGELDGDRHAWEVWHGLSNLGVEPKTPYATLGEAVHFRRYADDAGRFISEFGIHAAPARSTLQRWIPQDQLYLNSPHLLHHNKDQPTHKGWALMTEETAEPHDLDQYIERSMACQAEGLKFGVEHYRRRQPLCSGTLVWQFNEPWPGLTWSVLDHDLTPKAGYWFLQRAYKASIATFDVRAERLELWVTNSGRHELDLELVVELADPAGQVTFLAEVPVRAGAFSSRPVWAGDVPSAQMIPWVTDRTGQVPNNRRFLAPLKSLPLAGNVSATADETPTGVEVELTSTGYSYFTRVGVEGCDVRPDVNYLDLRHGESRTITLPGLSKHRIPDIHVACWGRPAIAPDQ